MRHLDEGTIHAWLDGALSAEDERNAESHAARCTQCASAVADARGFIAASSRILSALDDVPAGVIPQDYRAMPAASATRALVQPRRIPTWALGVAASLVVVAAGTLLVTRGSRNPSRESALARSESKELSPSASVPPAVATTPFAPAAGLADTPAPAAPLDAEAKQKAAAPQAVPYTRDSAAVSAGAAGGADAQGPERELALKSEASPAASAPTVTGALGAAPSATPTVPAPGLAADQAQLTAKAPKVATAVASNTMSANRAMTVDRLSFPGMRLVSDQTLAEASGLVQRRVFEVRPGVEVTLASYSAAPATPAAPSAGAPASEARKDADSTMHDSTPGASRAQFHLQNLDEREGVNSIQWTDSAGTEFKLSGPLPLDSLRALKTLLPSRPVRP